MILGFFFVRPVPIVSGKDAVKGSEEVELGRDEGEDGDVGMGGVEEEEERVTLLAAQQGVEIDSELEYNVPPPSPPSSTKHPRPFPPALSRFLVIILDPINPYVFEPPIQSSLIPNPPTVAGIGLTYINNVGLIAQSLYISSHPSPPPTSPSPGSEPTSSSYQSTQVSTISLCSFLGRIFIGLLTDYLKTSHSLPRSFD
ncbi:hypothetical protein H0H93_013108 [Arthromyces matolae]|nr:hypothetical protein H0H93_013108 [Arthromyces matolae]